MIKWLSARMCVCVCVCVCVYRLVLSLWFHIVLRLCSRWVGNVASNVLSDVMFYHREIFSLRLVILYFVHFG